MVMIDQANPANTATMRVRVVREAYGSNLPIAGRPRELTTWRFAGFVPGRPIFAPLRARRALARQPPLRRGARRVRDAARAGARRIPGVADVAARPRGR